ncbi:MAG: hypothetical protein AAF597_07235, partial [Bacteroidota bacterium]
MMTLRQFLPIVLLGLSSLMAQSSVIDVNFENDALQSFPLVDPFDASKPSQLWGDPENFSVLAATGNFGLSEAEGLVTMVRVDSPDQPFSRSLVFSGDNFFPPATAGVVQVSYDLIVEETPINQGYGYLRNFGAGFEGFADVVIVSDGNGFGIGPMLYPTQGEGFVDESTLAYFPVDQWYRITTVIDLTQGTFNVLIDGEDYGLQTNVGQIPAAGYTGSLLSWEAGFIGLMCIDNFRIALDDVAQGTLPVRWAGLSADWLDDCTTVNVRWDVSQESFAKSYQLERFETGADWNPVGAVMLAGERDYFLKDVVPRTEGLLYRVRQEDLNGVVHYSEVFGPDLHSCRSYQEIVVFPNPVSNYLQIQGGAQSAYLLMDAGGRMVRKGSLRDGWAELAVA